jgi:hypothetical protein
MVITALIVTSACASRTPEEYELSYEECKRKRGLIYFLTKKGEIYAKAGETDCSGTAAPYSAART